MAESTPLRPKTTYRRYLWDPTAPIPRSTLWNHRKRATENNTHEDGPPKRRQSTPHACSSSSEHIDNELNPLQSSPESTSWHSPPPELPVSPLTTHENSSHSSSHHLNSHSSSHHSNSHSSSPGSQHRDSTSSQSPLLQSPTSPSHSSTESSTNSPPESPTSPSHSSTVPSTNSSPESTYPSASPFQQQSHPDPLSDPQIFAPLYPGAEITLCGALCAIMQFCTSNKLTFTAIGELLKLLALLCPHPNLLPSSLYKFKKFFKHFHPIHGHHEICVQCQRNLEDSCSCSVANQENKAHLVHLEIHKPLKKILNDNWTSLRTPIPSTGETEVLRDVWDGSALSLLSSSDRFFSYRDNLALSISTDGVPLYKSSPVSLWPVYLVILNLPARIRMNAENVILCGIWMGRCKPIVNLLLKPITEHLKVLSTLGTMMQTSMGCVTIRAKLVMGIFDLPAKAAVLCCKQFNGEFGCTVCLHPGKRLSNNARIYLPDKVFPQRTHARVVASATLAERTRSCIQGILSTSPFVSTLDLVNSIPIDYMHAVLEGVTRWLMKAWFDSKFHSEAYYIGRDVQRIDQHLLKLCPPCEFSRPPRSIQKHFKYWKASELRNWLLFYSLPLLLEYLPSLYWHHYALLVTAMHILLGDSISLAHVDAAEQMLVDFCVFLPQLYGHQSCTANAHLLTHLTKFVRLWGPLWTHSAFGFESKNGRLKHLFHGNSKIFHQLLFNINVSYTLQKVHTHLLEYESEQTINYLHHIGSKRNMTEIDSHTYIVGQHKKVPANVEQSTVLHCDDAIEIFFRLFKDGVLYHSTGYFRATTGKRDNTYCCYQDTNQLLHFGRIEVFTTTPEPCALLRELSPLETTLINQAGHPCRELLLHYQEADMLSLFIVPVNISVTHSPLIAVPIDSIISKLVLVSVSDNHYCVVQPNNMERH